MARKVAKMAHEMELLESDDKYLPTPAEERAVELRGYLLDSYSGQLSLQQIKRLDYFLEERLVGRLDRFEFRGFLDIPFEKGGVGLNRRTAKTFAEQVEVMLANVEALKSSTVL